ncbi:helix-turn-helix domain-containing protein [Herbaspirillum sp. BH-1]|uniref:AlbA family DNA-binding domain-containing protein n=1 Tax=Herbaspirillum sp. (strain BH-1) TaxID=2058884 RepID=UPI001E6020BA|nr:ATP-binding protein [Herbaspirillum sp. BH-1]
MAQQTALSKAMPSLFLSRFFSQNLFNKNKGALVSILDLQTIDATFLSRICDEKWPENSTLDFKRQLPTSSGKDKHEFLKDVCSLANSGGGNILFGISEKDGCADLLFPISSEISDAAKRRLGQIVDAGIEPRLVGLNLQHIDVTGGYILVANVPPQFGGPYGMQLEGKSAFYMRNNTHSVELTYQQLRLAFGNASALQQRATSFRADRITALSRGKTLRPMVSGPLAVLHVIPLQGLASDTGIDMKSVASNAANLMSSSWGGGTHNYNLDGLLISVTSRGDTSDALGAYNQIYRSGCCEAVRFAGSFGEGYEEYMPSTLIGDFFREYISKFLRLLHEQEIAGPVVIGAALLNTEGKRFGTGGFLAVHPKSDRPDLILNEILLESPQQIPVDIIARPMLDVLWQAFGFEQCLDYDAVGQWSPRR